MSQVAGTMEPAKISQKFQHDMSLFQSQGQASQTMVRKVFAYAMDSMESGRYSTAITCFLSLVESTDDWRFRLFLAIAYSRAGMPSSARHQLVYVTEACPNQELRAVARTILKDLLLTECA